MLITPNCTETTINGVKCWKFTGDSLAEATAFARKVLSKGGKFYDPLTNQVSGVHKSVLDADMVRLLIAMSHYHKYNEFTTLVYPDEFPVLDKGVRGFTGEYAYLVHFGLLSRERDGDVTHYKLTPMGWEFVKGSTKVCRVLFNSGGTVHGFDETAERVDVKYFFSKQELEQMQKPLWFLPEKFRQEILTAEELAQ